MSRTMRVLLLCSWGGHLTEIDELRDAWSKYDYRFVTYRNRRTESMDEPKILITHPSKSVVRYAFDLSKCMFKICLERPDVVVGVGMGYVDIFLFPFCKMLRCKTIYIESCGNVTHTSNTAKLVRKFTDHFAVQWEELAESTGAEFHGRVI